MTENITVKQLVDILKNQDQDRVVVMSNDSEGNHFSPLAQLEVGLFVPGEAREGQVFPDKVSIKGSHKSIILYPED